MSKIESIVQYTFGKQKIMDDDSVSKPSAFFEIKEFYEQAEELGFNTRVHAQRKLTLTDQGLGLCLSTGTQLEDEPTKTKKKEKLLPGIKSKSGQTRIRILSRAAYAEAQGKPCC